MGQGASVADDSLELFTKQELIQLFYTTAVLSFDVLDIQCLNTNLGQTQFHQDKLLLQQEFIKLFRLPSSFPFPHLYRIVSLIGHFPFLQDFSPDNDLSLAQFIVASWLLTGRYTKAIKNLDYNKLIFVALANTDILQSCHKEPQELKQTSQHSKEDLTPHTSTPLSNMSDVYSIAVSQPTTENDSVDKKASKVIWSTFRPIVSFEKADISSLTISGRILSDFLAFIIVINYSRINNFNDDRLWQLLSNWQQIEPFTLSLLRYFDNDITETNLSQKQISFDQFSQVISTLFPSTLLINFKYLFKRVYNYRVPPQTSHDKLDSKLEFKESKLIDTTTLTYLSLMLNNLTTTIELDEHNLVKLYSGSDSGFSMRSIEQKIFKWRAPTIFFVSGKRVKSKTISTNKRYQSFDTEYPRFFKSTENSVQDWQQKNDKITYGILVCQPWKNSNKRNFGDENSIIFSILPRFDFYRSRHSTALKGELIYFNNSGFGIGFGNNQPINKQHIRKYVPGDVSLTIEPNLEFAVFRHLITPSNNSTRYFETSKQEQLKSENFEDRFTISDIEVWGVGSKEQLDEQKKQWEWENKQAEARQGVNLRSIGEERAFLEMVGLVGNLQGGGSM